MLLSTKPSFPWYNVAVATDQCLVGGNEVVPEPAGLSARELRCDAFDES